MAAYSENKMVVCTGVRLTDPTSKVEIHGIASWALAGNSAGDKSSGIGSGARL